VAMTRQVMREVVRIGVSLYHFPYINYNIIYIVE